MFIHQGERGYYAISTRHLSSHESSVVSFHTYAADQIDLATTHDAARYDFLPAAFVLDLEAASRRGDDVDGAGDDDVNMHHGDRAAQARLRRPRVQQPAEPRRRWQLRPVRHLRGRRLRLGRPLLPPRRHQAGHGQVGLRLRVRRAPDPGRRGPRVVRPGAGQPAPRRAEPGAPDGARPCYTTAVAAAPSSLRAWDPARS